MSQFASNINWEEIAESQPSGIGGYPDSVQKQAELEKLRTSLKTNAGNLGFEVSNRLEEPKRPLGDNGDLSFFDKYKTYILVGAFIVTVVVGYFVYEKYFK